MKTRVFLFLLLVCASGCRTPKAAIESRHSEEPAPLSDQVRQQLYTRGLQTVERVLYFKPHPEGHDPIDVQLAPLMLRDGRNASADAAPEVRFLTNTVTLGNQRFEQRTFEWFVDRSARRRVVQSVRLTFDAAGLPAIWEVRHDPSGAEIIWVSQKFEIGAAAQFGKPLAGRVLSAARSTADAPRFVEGGIVDDGPMPMGPMLYVAADGTVLSIACRCSAFEARSLEDRGTYRLRRATNSAQGRIDDDWFDPARLEKRLRIPDAFREGTP